MTDDTRQALLANPEYWLKWYTFKSLALVAAVAGVAYLLGKEAGRE
jgi:hypothetical protein